MVWHGQMTRADDADEVPFYGNQAALAFLSDASTQYFVCGLKGVGKTLLLAQKSAALRRQHHGVRFLPETELVETLTSNLSSLGDQQVSRLRDWTVWQTIWRAALGVVVARGAGVHLPESIRTLFPGLDNSRSVLDHLNTILSDRLLQFVDNYLPHVGPELGAALGEVRNGVHLFVDAVDDLVLLHSGEPLRLHERERYTQYGRLSGEVWVAAQIGFAKAAMDIHRNHHHIRIYGTFRYEALERYSLADRQNLAPHIMHIQYSRGDLASIFKTKLAWLEKSTGGGAFAKSEGESVVGRFLGFDTIEHPTVKNGDRSPFSEHVVDYILRHTRGRPRELDEIGKGLQAIPIQDRTPAAVRDRVRNRSRDFFAWARSEAVPYWPAEADELLQMVGSNWISATDAARLPGGVGRDGALSKLFMNGLIGCTISQMGSSTLELRFRQFDPELPVTESDFSVATHFAVHPCVNLATFSDKRVPYQPSPWNVSAHGREYVAARNMGHVHLGAGALGVGCVIPLLTTEPGIGVCVLQRAGKARWDTLSAARVVSISHRLLNPTTAPQWTARWEHFTVIRDDDEAETVDRLLEEWGRGERHLFHIGSADGSPLAKRILGLAGTVSTSVGSDALARIESVLESSVQAGTRVYAFENDEDAVTSLQRALARCGAELVPVSVDRICLEPSVTSTPTGDVAIEGHVEAFQRVVILDGSNFTNRLLPPSNPVVAKHVEVVGNAVSFQFARLRKRILVNGLHFFFGMASRQYLEKTVGGVAAESIAEAQASQLLVRSQEVQDIVDLTNRLFLQALLVQAEKLNLVTTVQQARELEQELYDQQATVQDRLQTVPDQLNRILRLDDRDLLRKARRFLQGLRQLPLDLRASRVVRQLLPSGGFDRLQRDVEQLNSLFLSALLDGTRAG